MSQRGADGRRRNYSCSASESRAKRDALVNEHLEWAKSIAAKIARRLPTWFTPDDLSGAAMIALIQCAAAYDANTGVPFRAYAISRIRGACIDAIRRKEYFERSLPSLSDKDDGKHEAALPDPAPGPHELADRALESATVWKLVQTLPYRHRVIIEWVYSPGIELNGPIATVARYLGIHPTRASQIHGEALRMLRTAIESTPRRRQEPERRKCRPLRSPIRASHPQTR